MAVFIAGATKITGFRALKSPSTRPVVSQALMTESKRLSAMPIVIFAIVLADNGATSKTCAHFRSCGLVSFGQIPQQYID